MGANSKIAWTERTWNPTVGCTKVSPGCDHCYAETLVNRFAPSKGFPERFDTLVMRDHFLDHPFRWRTPQLVFVNSLSDLFHKDVPDEFIARVFAVMAATQQHTYQLLTKRHDRMRALLSDRDGFVAAVRAEVGRIIGQPEQRQGSLRFALDDWALAWPLPNLWLGVSAEDTKRAQLRVPALMHTPAAVRYVSGEPLVGKLEICTCDVGPWQDFPHEDCPVHGRVRLDWVILGGESGPGARALDTQWVTGAVGDLVFASVPVFVKQLGSEWAKAHGAKARKGEDPAEWPEQMRVRQWPGYRSDPLDPSSGAR